jgi:hypothetical protein
MNKASPEETLKSATQTGSGDETLALNPKFGLFNGAKFAECRPISRLTAGLRRNAAEVVGSRA